MSTVILTFKIKRLKGFLDFVLHCDIMPKIKKAVKGETNGRYE